VCLSSMCLVAPVSESTFAKALLSTLEKITTHHHTDDLIVVARRMQTPGSYDSSPSQSTPPPVDCPLFNSWIDSHISTMSTSTSAAATAVSPSMSCGDGASLASTTSFTTTPPFVANVTPAPEYISLSSASQLATEAVDARADDHTTLRIHHRATVAESTLASVNQFMDRQLYEWINVARSTSLDVLKLAVTEVLKKSLAREAIASADENLQDLLALQADDTFDQDASQPASKWNLEFTWKRSRLRVMMRTEKSDFDIDDDERYVRDEKLTTSFSETAGIISLASEIFLAGVLDYLGDMLLAMATHVAIARVQRRGSTTSTLVDQNTEVTYILVQDCDLERAVLNSPVDRQWRAWRKSMRSATRTSPSFTNSPAVRKGSLWDRIPDRPENHYPEHVLASNIPLPQSNRDVDEIEVPGLAKDPSHAVSRPHRPQSAGFGARRSEFVAKARRNSVPTPIATPFVDAPGAWPDTTPLAELEDASTNLIEPEKESLDSAHTQKASISSIPTSIAESVSAIKAVQRSPKRLAIYGPSASNLDGPFSPEDFLAGRNLNDSLSGLTPTFEEDKSNAFGSPAELPAEPFDEHDCETAISLANSDASPKTSPLTRQFPGFGFSTSASDSSSRTPATEQRVSTEFLRSRKPYTPIASSGNNKGSLREISTTSNRDSLDGRRKHVTPPKNAEQDFDALLNSEETIKFTLTPETVRDMPARPSSTQNRVKKQTLFRSNSRENFRRDSDNQSMQSTRSTTWSIQDRKDSRLAEETPRKTSISRPSTQNVRPLPSGHFVREPVMQTDSTRDFSDFIRSTAPDKEPNPVVPSLAPTRSIAALRAMASAQVASLNNAPPLPSSAGKYTPRSPLGPPFKRNLTARAATGSSDNNSSLIDFIRSGPPEAATKTRQPNVIAPFADWDGESELLKAISGADETPKSCSSRPLTSSSSDSRSGLLLNRASESNYGSSQSPQLPSLPLIQPSLDYDYTMTSTTRHAVSDDGRKRTRIKDPYAIPGDFDDDDGDDDDDDDDYYYHEDRLVALPVYNAFSTTGAEKSRNNSIPSLHSSIGRPSPATSNGNMPALSTSSLSGGSPIHSANSSSTNTAMRPAHITSQISSNGYIPRSNKPKPEVRSAGVSVKNSTRLDPFHPSTGTSDLADFLMSSGPPEPPQRRAAEPAKSEKKAKFWQRGNKSASNARATYTDLP
jgi:hypothetical protein